MNPYEGGRGEGEKGKSPRQQNMQHNQKNIIKSRKGKQET